MSSCASCYIFTCLVPDMWCLLPKTTFVACHSSLERRVDLLVTDIEMPFMDGLDLVQAMRSDPSVAPMPVIFVSSQWEQEGRARELGAVAFLRKPVLADQLLATVAKHLRAEKPAEVKG